MLCRQALWVALALDAYRLCLGCRLTPHRVLASPEQTRIGNGTADADNAQRAREF